MEYLKLKTVIKKFCQAACVFMLVQAAVCGCGIKSGAEGNISGTPEGSTEADYKESINKDAGKSKDTSTRENNIEENTNASKEKEDEVYLYKNVPVYGKEEKEEIKKYLASFPDNITAKEAKEKGIVIETYRKNESRFQSVWHGFYKYAMEGEEAENPQDGVIKCYAEPFRAAVVVLAYTVEGDACYTYISFTEDGYYIFTDSSRDAYKAASWDGYSEIGTFKSLRKREEVIEEEGEKYLNITYSVYKKQNISEKEINEIIKEDDAYINKYYDIYSYCTTIED